MNADCLKLTTYFGERDRTEDGLLADELMHIYAASRMAASIILRGAEGFGRLHHLQTDRLLTLSEDLPVVSVAIDERARVESMLERLLQVQRRGLITLERARLLTGEVGHVRLPEELGEATKLTIYLGRQDRIGGIPAHVALCELMQRRGLSGASVLLGVDGTRGGSRSRARFFGRNSGVPMMLVAVGAGDRIAAVLPEIGALLHEPLITLERVRLCKRDGELLSDPHELPRADEHGLAVWQKLMIYTSNTATDGHARPLHLEIVRRLARETDAAGATVLRGIWGFHGDHAPHGDRVFQVRRHVPVCTIVIDRPDRIARSFRVVDEITGDHGLVTSEMVPAAQAMSAAETRGGLRLARHRF